MSSVGLVIARKSTPVSRDTAWAHLVDRERRSAWWAELELEPQLGGKVSERWIAAGDEANSVEMVDAHDDSEPPADAGTVTRDAVGTVDVCVPGHALGFRWRDRSDQFETEVLITLRSQDGGTGITVTETGFGRFSDAHTRVADAQQGWIDLLSEFVGALATAAPHTSELEVAAQPISGEIADDYDGDISADSTGADANTADHNTVDNNIDDENTDTVPIEIEAEPEVAELVATVEEPEVVVAEPIDGVLPDDNELVIEAEPEAVEIEVENPDDPDFDSLLRGN